MSDHTWSRRQIRLPDFSPLALNPNGTNRDAWFIFQSSGKIDNGASFVPSPLPVRARALHIGSEKSKIDAGKLFRPHALDEINLVPGSLKLANRFVIVKQANIGSREVPLVQHFGNFLALQGGCAHDDGPVEMPARSWRRRRCNFRCGVHEVCEASL